MKKIISQSTVFSLGVVLFFSLAVFPGCKKEVENNQNPNPPTPSLTVSADPESVDYNGSSKVTYGSSNLDSLILNNEKFPFTGNFMLNNLKRDTSLVFVGYYTVTNNDKADITTKTITKTASIAVGDSIFPPPTTITLSTNEGEDTIPWNTMGGINGEVFNADSTVSDVPGFPVLGGSWGINTPFLTTTTTYHFWVYLRGEMVVEDSITIFVEPYPYSDTMRLLTIANGWSLDSMWLKVYEDDEWEYHTVSEGYKSFWRIYYVNGKYEFYKPPNILSGGGSWSFSNNETVIRLGDDWHIVILNDSMLKIWAKIPCLDCEVDSTFLMESYNVHQEE